MRCDEIRLELSARLDEESTVVPAAELEGHLRDCAECRAWLAGAERATAAVRAHRPQPPDLTASILAAVRADAPKTKAARLDAPQTKAPLAPNTTAARVIMGVRWALGLLAVLTLLLAIPGLLTEAGHETHSGREVAAFDVALAVGFLFAACYPVYARALVPVASALAICLFTSSAVDVASGTVSWAHELPHLVAVLQAGLIWLLGRRLVTPGGAETAAVGSAL
jgi:predicted anti-sigma-YlaC factor YlaD